MKIVLEIDEKTPLNDGDLLIYNNGKVQSLKKVVFLRDVIKENELLKKEIKELKIKVYNLTKVIKEITK